MRSAPDQWYVKKKQELKMRMESNDILEPVSTERTQAERNWRWKGVKVLILY